MSALGARPSWREIEEYNRMAQALDCRCPVPALQMVSLELGLAGDRGVKASSAATKRQTYR